MEDGRTNVADNTRISLICGYIFQRLSWLDGMPVVFNYPLETSPNADDFEVTLIDKNDPMNLVMVVYRLSCLMEV